jgi:protein-disulfide isomerase
MSVSPASSALSISAIVLSLAVAGYTAWATKDNNPFAMAEMTSQSVPEQTNNTENYITRDEFGNMVREYLTTNPQIMLEVQEALEEQQQQDQLLAQQKALNEKEEKIFRSEHQVEIGNENASITIVEFYDYNCGYCQRALADMTRFVEEDPSVRFILKEFPVLGEPSLEAHRVSIAFSRQYPEQAGDFHIALLKADGRKDGRIAMDLAVQMGADRDRLESELDAPYVMEAIRESYELADSLGITGTPSYVVGDEVVFGAVGFSSLNQKVAAIKECGKANC